MGGRGAADWMPQWGAAAIAGLMTVEYYGSVKLGWQHRVPILLLLSAAAVGLAVYSFTRGLNKQRALRRRKAMGRLNRFQDEVAPLR